MALPEAGQLFGDHVRRRFLTCRDGNTVHGRVLGRARARSAGAQEAVGAGCGEGGTGAGLPFFAAGRLRRSKSVV